MPDTILSTESAIREFDQAVEQNQLTPALESLRALCRVSDSPPDDAAVRRIVERLDERKWLQATEPVIEQHLKEDDPSPVAGRLWSRIKLARSDWDAYKQLRPLLEAGSAGEAATLAWIEELVARKESVQMLRLAALGEHWLSSNVRTWGATIDALCTLREYRQARFWITDWQEVEAASARDLLLISEILRASGQDSEAAEANNRALERYPDHPLSSVHRCWLAVDDALAGDFEAADRRLESVDAAEFTPEDRSLHTLLAASVGIGRADAGRLSDVLAEACQSIGDAREADPAMPQCPARMRLYRHVVRQVGNAGGLTDRIWAWWRNLRT